MCRWCVRVVVRPCCCTSCGTEITPIPQASSAPRTSNGPDQHSADESDWAGQHDTDDREQRAGSQECRPPTSPRDTCEPQDTDDREQNSSAKPPADPPAACEPGTAPISGPAGRGGGGTPHHKVPAMRPHSHGRLLRRRWHTTWSVRVYLQCTSGVCPSRRAPSSRRITLLSDRADRRSLRDFRVSWGGAVPPALHCPWTSSSA